MLLINGLVLLKLSLCESLLEFFCKSTVKNSIQSEIQLFSYVNRISVIDLDKLMLDEKLSIRH